MKKAILKALSVMLAVVLTLTAAPLSGFVGLELPEWLDFSIKSSAATTSGTCGNNLTWTFDESTGTLTISGTGDMYDYYYGLANSPWFESYNNIITVVINYGVTSIGGAAFENCNSLTSVTIPDGVISIDNHAFDNCNSLTSVTIPDSVIIIDKYAFYDCDSLTSVTIPDSVTLIDADAFSYCDSLTSVTIGESAKIASYFSFRQCQSLIRITVDNKNQYYSNDEFGVLFNKNKTTLIQYPIGDTRTHYTIPDSVTSIGDCAFEYCNSLTSVTIPDSVTSIGYGAFSCCFSLTNITIPDSVTSIGEYAFSSCTSLTGVTIPDSVTSIGDMAFSFCDNLTVIVPNSVTSIGNKAFYKCKSVIWLSAEDKITISNDIYTCLVGESFYISGDICATENVGGISLSWTSDDGVELNLPASVIISSDTHASFSVQAKGIKAGTYTVRVVGNNDRADSCQVKVIEPKSDLVVSVEKTIDTDYYCAGDTLVDYNLNEHDSVSFKITVKNKLSDECAGMSLTDEIKDKLKINNISIDSALDDYSALAVDIADLTDLKNIGTLEVGEEKVIIFDVYPLKLEGKEISANLNLTATADDKDDISKSMPILIKDKLYDPYIGITFTVDQEVIYKDKKYDSESVPVIIKITNKIPSDFNGDISKLKQLSGYDITVNSAKITVDNADLFKSTSVNATGANKTIKPGETITLEGNLNIKTNHKIPDDVEYEYANISYNVTSSANTCTGSKEVIFVNQDFDYKKNWRVQSLEELIKQMESMLSQCHVITPADRILVAEILDAIQMSSGIDKLSNQLDGLECIYDLSCYATGLKGATAKNAGKLLIAKIKDECTNASDVLKNEVEDTLKTLTNSEAFNEFAYWYYNEQKVNEGKVKKANNHCPIDITVKDESGNVVLSIVNDEIVVSSDEIACFVCEGEKTIYLPSDKNYSLIITATGNGTMDYSIVERASDGELRVVSYDDITLSTGDSFVGDISNEVLPTAEDYNLTKNENVEIKYDSVSTEEHLHSYLLDLSITPTCTQTGVEKYVCTLCDKEDSKIVEATGHTHKATVTAPTCALQGYTTYICDCGDAYISDYVEATGEHQYSARNSNDPTCTTEGFVEYCCDVCENATYTETIPALGHNFVSGNCTACGEKDPSIPDEPEYNYTFSIQTPSRAEIRNKDGIILHAVVDGTAPNDYYVRWESSNGNFDEDADGNKLEIIAKNKGYTTFTAILCDADGNELARDSVEMYSKSGFFDKIGGFFRSLFGSTKIYSE